MRLGVLRQSHAHRGVRARGPGGPTMPSSLFAQGGAAASGTVAGNLIAARRTAAGLPAYSGPTDDASVLTES